jgi:predicted nucleic acid-binding protein
VIVVDASVLTDFLLARPQAVEALRLEVAADVFQPLHAPALVEPETLNALRRLVGAGRLTEERAGAAVEDLDDTRMIRYPHTPFRARVWEMRHELTAYDASYLALAERLDDSVLLTGDGGLAARARESLGARRVRHIE